jgi:hypothetical protein
MVKRLPNGANIYEAEESNDDSDESWLLNQHHVTIGIVLAQRFKDATCNDLPFLSRPRDFIGTRQGRG